MVHLAVDIGGTFTDLMAFDPARATFHHAKSPTTPDDFAQGVIDCIAKCGLDIAAVDDLIHGTTVAINTLIERRGAKTALLVTSGTRDVYLIGRGNRPESYNLLFRRPRPLVPRRLTHEVAERLLASGEVRTALDAHDVEAIAERIAAEGVEAVAVCFLHSFTNPAHEREAGAILAAKLPGCYISLSHEILREYREYERISTTVVNAYVGPRVAGYVRNLETKLGAIGFTGELAIMQSNGGVMAPEIAMRRPVTMMESGPVGGIIASAAIGRGLGFDNVVAFDMGGTTAKASLIRDAEPTMSEGYHVGGYASGDPVMLPVVDVVEIGAGGGSIAWIDEVGALKVGPRSAGAAPGPICYRLGGAEPTITDANVVLGRIGADDFLGGEMPLDESSARAGIAARIGEALDMDPVRAADAILRIAIAKMSLAVREVSVEKGYDPRDFALVAAGGAGPLHAVAVARELHIPTVIVPPFPAHFSALGMLMADERHDLIRTRLAALADLDLADLMCIRDEMIAEARSVLRETANVEHRFQLDLRYVGQEFCLSVAVTEAELRAGDAAAIRRAFDALHELRYAHHAADEPVEMVNIRLATLGRRDTLALPTLASAATTGDVARRAVHLDGSGTALDCPVYIRDRLAAGAAFAGPALVQEYASATVLFANDACVVAETGELVISVGSES